MMNERIELVQLKPKCWEILKDLKLRSVAEEPIAFEDFDILINNYIDRTDETWKEWLASPNRISLFARSEDQVVGMVSATLGNNTAYIQHMYVEKQSRGKGVGKMLLEKLLKSAKSKGAKKGTLGVLETQKIAINLYESLGFRAKTWFDVTRGNQTFQEIQMEKEL